MLKKQIIRKSLLAAFVSLCMMFSLSSTMIFAIENETGDSLTENETAPAASVTIGDETIIYSYGSNESYASSDEALLAAWKSAQGKTATVTLLESVRLSYSNKLEVTKDSDITLKMNNNATITGYGQTVNTGLIHVDGGSLKLVGGTVAGFGENTNGIFVTNNGNVSIYDNSTIQVSGSSNCIGVYVDNGQIELNDTQIVINSASGAGIYASGSNSKVVANNCSITAAGNCNGVKAENSSNITINNSRIAGNACDINLESSSVAKITDSTFTSPGISAKINDSAIEIVNSTFTKNLNVSDNSEVIINGSSGTAARGFDVINVNGSNNDIQIIDSEISSNINSGNGVGLAGTDNKITITNSSIIGSSIDYGVIDYNNSSNTVITVTNSKLRGVCILGSNVDVTIDDSEINNDNSYTVCIQATTGNVELNGCTIDGGNNNSFAVLSTVENCMINDCTITGTAHGVNRSAGKVTISDTIITASEHIVFNTSGSVKDMLASGNAYYDSDNKLITEGLDSGSLSGPATISVKKCSHNYIYTDNENEFHTRHCQVCDDAITLAHVYENGKCKHCGAQKETVNYNLNVYIDNELDNTQTTTYEEGTAVIVKAKSVSGRKFSHWALNTPNGSVLSSNENYAFRLTGNMSVYAVYVDESETVEKLPQVAVTDVHTSGSKIAYEITRSVPSGYTVVETGVLYGTSTSVLGNGVADENLKFADSNTNGATTDLKAKVYKRAFSSKSSAGSTIWYLNVGTTVDRAVYVRGYVVVKDSKGQYHYVYSDVIDKTYQQVANGDNGIS